MSKSELIAMMQSTHMTSDLIFWALCIRHNVHKTFLLAIILLHSDPNTGLTFIEGHMTVCIESRHSRVPWATGHNTKENGRFMSVLLT